MIMIQDDYNISGQIKRFKVNKYFNNINKNQFNKIFQDSVMIHR